MKQIACVFQHSSASYRTRCAPLSVVINSCSLVVPVNHTLTPRYRLNGVGKKRKSRQARENVNSFTLSSPSSVIETHQFTRCGDNERRLHPRIWWHVLYMPLSQRRWWWWRRKKAKNWMKWDANLIVSTFSYVRTVYVVRSSFTSLLNSTEHMLQMDIFRKKRTHISHVRVCSRRFMNWLTWHDTQQRLVVTVRTWNWKHKADWFHSQHILSVHYLLSLSSNRIFPSFLFFFQHNIVHPESQNIRVIF